MFCQAKKHYDQGISLRKQNKPIQALTEYLLAVNSDPDFKCAEYRSEGKDYEIRQKQNQRRTHQGINGP